MPILTLKEKLKLRSVQMLKQSLISFHKLFPTLNLVERSKPKVKLRLNGAEEDLEDDVLSEESSGLSLDSGEDAWLVAVDSSCLLVDGKQLRVEDTI